MSKYLFYFAISCWYISLLLNIIAIFGIDVESFIPFLWLFHIGVFIVFIPMVYDSFCDKTVEEATISQSTKTINYYLDAFSQAPKWIITLAFLSVFYLGVTSLFFHEDRYGQPYIENGLYVLREHGSLLKTLTEKEYHFIKSIMLRESSSSWIIGYGLCATVLYSKCELTDKKAK